MAVHVTEQTSIVKVLRGKETKVEFHTVGQVVPCHTMATSYIYKIIITSDKTIEHGTTFTLTISVDVPEWTTTFLILSRLDEQVQSFSRHKQ